MNQRTAVLVTMRDIELTPAQRAEIRRFRLWERDKPCRRVVGGLWPGEEAKA